MSWLFKQLANLTSRYPRRILFAWLALLVLALPLSLRVNRVFTTDPGYSPGSEAAQVQALLEAHFEGRSGFRLLLAAEAKTNSSLELLERQFKQQLETLRALEAVKAVRSSADQVLIPGFAPELRSSLALIELEAANHEAAVAATQEVKARLASPSLNYYLTGPTAAELEIQEISKRDALRAEALGLSISLIVLIVVFGALIAASLPLLTALSAILMAFATLYILGQFGPVAHIAQSIVTLLGLATGIDYALLMVNRFREELALGLTPQEAARRTSTSAGKAVAVSGVTVMVALSALLIPPLAFIQSIGLASMVVMFFSVAISVTALPALLCLLGHRVNALALGQAGTRSRSLWRNWARIVMTRPWRWTLLGSAVLILICLPALTMKLAISGVRGLTAETDLRRAERVLEALELSELQRSFDVIIDFGERGFFHPSSVRALSELSRDLQALEVSERLLSPVSATNVPPLLLYQYYAQQAVALKSPLEPLVRATVGQAGRYVLLRLFPDPASSQTELATLTGQLRNALHERGLSATIGGSYIEDREWTKALYGSFPLAVAVVYLATFLLLGLAFNSLLIPIKSIILNTLTVGAAFGAITLVFQSGWGATWLGLEGGYGFVETSVPIFIFAIVFGLSMDYEVFLVSRIYEGHKQGLSDRAAVLQALERTGNVISSAALIMIIVFSAFIVSHIVIIKTLSVGLSVAVLLDATLVRFTLVPAVMLLAGKWNWWLPGPVARLTKRIDLSHD